MSDWQTYCDSIRKRYQRWWEVVPSSHGSPLPFDMWVGELDELVWIEERFEILTGLRQSSLHSCDPHVLLHGKPGAGKSTALARLLFEEASEGKEDRIPVLVELRSYKTSVIDSIQDFCKSHGVRLEKEKIENLLSERRFFLLFDGIDELPSDEAANEVRQFRKTYPRVPMVFTTRESESRGNLGIEQHLTVLPLTETQVTDFARGYLKDEELLKQLQDRRLRKLAETPLGLSILCSIYRSCGRIPDTLGEAFRQFTRIDEGTRANVTARGSAWESWADSLQYLAFQMTLRKDGPVIPVGEAEEIVRDFLRENGKNPSCNRQREWLEDLIRLHLIRKRDGETIEFPHQLLKDYYAAEYLAEQLVKLTDNDLQWHYLNNFKWTGSIALMLGFLKDKEQALRVVRLALAVDLGLGARLAGEVNPLWQAETVGFLAQLAVNPAYRVYLLGKTRSEEVLDSLILALGDESEDVRREAAVALGEIGSDRAVEPLINALGSKDMMAHAAEALGKIGSYRTVEALINALGDENEDVPYYAAVALGKTGSERAIESLINALGDEYNFLYHAAEALGKIGSERAVEPLIHALRTRDCCTYDRVAFALSKIGSERTVELFINALDNSEVPRPRGDAPLVSGIGSEMLIELLMASLNDLYGFRVGCLALKMREIGAGRVIELLISALNDENETVRGNAICTLGYIGSERAVEPLIPALDDKHWRVRCGAVAALGSIGSERTVEALTTALGDEDKDVREYAEDELKYHRSEKTIPGLSKLLENPDLPDFRKVIEVIKAIQEKYRYYTPVKRE